MTQDEAFLAAAQSTSADDVSRLACIAARKEEALEQLGEEIRSRLEIF